MEKEAARAAFAARLNEICDDMRVPPKGSARQTTVASIFQVTQKGARKWLEGEGYPELDKVREIAEWASVHFEWLMTGRGAKLMTSGVQETAARYMQEASPADLAKRMTAEAAQLMQAWLGLPEIRRKIILQQITEESGITAHTPKVTSITSNDADIGKNSWRQTPAAEMEADYSPTAKAGASQKKSVGGKPTESG